MKKLWIFWGGSLHYWTNLGGGVISIHFGVFSLGKVQNGNLFWGHKISEIYLGMPDIPDIFMG